MRSLRRNGSALQCVLEVVIGIPAAMSGSCLHLLLEIFGGHCLGKVVHALSDVLGRERADLLRKTQCVRRNLNYSEDPLTFDFLLRALLVYRNITRLNK